MCLGAIRICALCATSAAIVRVCVCVLCAYNDDDANHNANGKHRPKYSQFQYQ